MVSFQRPCRIEGLGYFPTSNLATLTLWRKSAKLLAPLRDHYHRKDGIGMEKNWKIVDGHIVAKVPLSQELPTMKIELHSGRTTYRFSGSYDGTRSLSAKVLRLMDKDGDVDGEKTDGA